MCTLVHTYNKERGALIPPLARASRKMEGMDVSAYKEYIGTSLSMNCEGNVYVNSQSSISQTSLRLSKLLQIEMLAAPSTIYQA